MNTSLRVEKHVLKENGMLTEVDADSAESQTAASASPAINRWTSSAEEASARDPLRIKSQVIGRIPPLLARAANLLSISTDDEVVTNMPPRVACEDDE